MATKNPLIRVTGSVTRLHQSCPSSQCRRTFTTSSPQSASPFSRLSRQISKQKSLKSQMQSLRRSQIPDDIGLLPETFIRDRKNFPALFSKNMLKRIKLELSCYLNNARAFVGLVYMNKWNVNRSVETNKYIRRPLFLRERYAAIRRLHTDLYRAIAEAKTEVIDQITCSGLRRQLTVRLDQRRSAGAPNEKFDIQYTGAVLPDRRGMWIPNLILWPGNSVVVVSDRQAPLPFGGQDANLRQVIARVRSKQTLRKEAQYGKPAETKTEQKTEYVVIQKMMIDGEEDEWKIWGTTEPTSEREILEMEKRKESNKQDGVFARIKTLLSGSLGGGGNTNATL